MLQVIKIVQKMSWLEILGLKIV